MHKLDMRSLKWTYEACYKEAKKYSTVADFENKSKSAYTIALRNKWRKDYVWLSKVRRTPWTLEEIKMLVKNNNIEYQKELQCKFCGAYDAARKNGWLKELNLKLRKKAKWTYEEVYEVAKQYDTIKDFRKDKNNAYCAAVKYDWLRSFHWLQRGYNVFTDNIDCCYMYLNEEKKIVYVGRTYRKKERALQHKMGKTGIKKEFEKLGIEFPEPIYYMNGATFPVTYGLMIEDKLVNWFKEQGWTVLNKAKTGVSSGSIGGVIKKWSKNAILAAASKCCDMEEFYEKYNSAYRKAIELGIDVGISYKVKPNGYWHNKENCRLEAQKYENLCDFIKYSRGAYKVSLDNGWLEEFFPNKKQIRKKTDRTVEMLSKGGTLLREFNSPKEAGIFLGKNECSRIYLCVNGKAETAFGYQWRYKKGSLVPRIL